MNNIRSAWWLRWVIVPLLGVFGYSLFFVMSPTEGIADYYTAYGWDLVFIDLPTVMLAAVLIFELGRIANNWLNKRMPWNNRPIRRMVVQFLVQAVISSLVVTGCFCFWDWQENAANQTPDYIFMMGLVIGSLLSLILTAIYVALYFIDEWKATLLEAERLKRESVEARFEALKSQLDPHFLFNNLNTLMYLVEDHPQAASFVENLSLVYRYVLQNRERTLVPLSDELRLAKAYLFLLKQRFGEAIQVEMAVSDAEQLGQLPPMTLQLLIENAVKHNIVSEKNPLLLTIRCCQTRQLTVSNTLQRKIHSTETTGIGLRNIRHRYELLGNAQMQVWEENSEFVVRIPLLRTHELTTH
jgi:two-component system, LytTR family, sensor kinase